jgi:Ser/Thr protein kinase RdoA (MazF antagonist)
MHHVFETLTPDLVLDALKSVGLRGDGRLTALSSYENRVYQVQLEDGSAVVAKFYRPERWSEAQILEEHAFTRELMEAEIPAVGPLLLHGRTLHTFEGFAFTNI